MLSERMLSKVVGAMGSHYLATDPCPDHMLPGPIPGKRYMLYMHVPFCQKLCPYCSFNRFPFQEEKARRYFVNLRKEMLMLKELGYDFESVYVGGGTPTIMMDELAQTLALARESFHIQEVSSETNPNHLVPEYLEQLSGMVQRLSVGVQSFDNGLLKQMQRFEKYGDADTILHRVQDVAASGMFKSLNVDMIFNFPSQTREMLLHDIEMVKQTGCNQVTFNALMASPSVEKSLRATVGMVDYEREYEYYQLISQGLTGGPNPPFRHNSSWTFGTTRDAMIDEYIVDYEEYPAIGSGGFSYLDGSLYVNTFSVNDYNEAIEAGHMSVTSKTDFSKRDRMRYRFMMQLFGGRLDVAQWKRDFGCSVAAGLPAEYAFMKAAGAFAHEDGNEITLTPKGQYLSLVMMRQFFIGVNSVRDQARASLSGDERILAFGE
ncbi:MAG: coproporphyrinogen III oxidase family protein [Coriobacteriales bacterium]|nr:coproporphyrinogen III oxidase family protein [Coriobacteriales bacterium]